MSEGEKGEKMENVKKITKKKEMDINSRRIRKKKSGDIMEILW